MKHLCFPPAFRATPVGLPLEALLFMLVLPSSFWGQPCPLFRSVHRPKM